MELSASANGGQGLACSNKHYGVPHNLIAETLGKDMGDGWETARHPDRPAILVKDPTTNLIDSPLQDWAILKLGKIAVDGVARIILDTKHFRGNYPESVLLEGCFAEQGMTDDRVSDQGGWFPLINRTRMAPDSEHVFETDLEQLENPTRAVTHVRVSIFPDGGLSRVRVYGKPLEMGEDGVRSNL
jgi:allantoicase